MTTEISKTFPGGLVVTLEVENSTRRFQWQLKSKTTASGWTSYYEGLVTLKVGNRLFAAATDYWHGALPTNVPFEIVEGK